MTPKKDETAGGRGGNGGGLPGPTSDACLEGVLGGVAAREWCDASLSAPVRRLRKREFVIESSERPAVVAGRIPSGKSRLRDVTVARPALKKWAELTGQLEGLFAETRKCTLAESEESLWNVRNRDRIIEKEDSGRGSESVREDPAQSFVAGRPLGPIHMIRRDVRRNMP